MKVFKLDDILHLEKQYRVSLINKISGFKSANLIGSISSKGVTNLAIFNSVTHIGASPPLLGFIMRPLTVERHTYENIKSQSYYTINGISKSIYKKAHLTSAKYPQTVSEFDAADLTQEFIKNFPAPFVRESNIKIGLSYQEEHLIKSNQTILMVGKIEYLILPQNIISEEGDIDLAALDSIAIAGLDSYYTCKRIDKLPYARIKKSPEK